MLALLCTLPPGQGVASEPQVALPADYCEWELADYAIAEPICGLSGDAARGKAISSDGSRGNCHVSLLEKLDCRNFLVSTNGNRHHHPDMETIAQLVGGRWRENRDDIPINLIFNYRTKYNEVWEDNELGQEWQYQTFFPPLDMPDRGLGLPVPKTDFGTAKRNVRWG